jgi:hypothetical protein
MSTTTHFHKPWTDEGGGTSLLATAVVSPITKNGLSY